MVEDCSDATGELADEPLDVEPSGRRTRNELLGLDDDDDDADDDDDVEPEDAVEGAPSRVSPD